MHNLAAITGATSGQILAMKDVILETANRTKYSTGEIAEGMVLLGQAGLDAGESIQAIGAVADLAAGTLSNLRTVADLVTTGDGVSVLGVGLAANKLRVEVQNSGTTVL